MNARSPLLVLLALAAAACATGSRAVPRAIALVFAGESETSSGPAVTAMNGHLDSVVRRLGESGASDSIVVHRVAAADQKGIGDVHAELADALLQLRGGVGELFVYWCGPAFVRGQGDGADVCLGRPEAALSLTALREFLVIAPESNIVFVVDGAVEDLETGARAMKRAFENVPCTFWLTGRGEADRRGAIDSEWAVLFCSQLERSEDAAGAAATWQRLREVVDRQRAQRQRPTSVCWGNGPRGKGPEGFAWLWLAGKVAVIEPATSSGMPATSPEGEVEGG